jgi:hypothetical protein
MEKILFNSRIVTPAPGMVFISKNNKKYNKRPGGVCCGYLVKSNDNRWFSFDHALWFDHKNKDYVRENVNVKEIPWTSAAMWFLDQKFPDDKIPTERLNFIQQRR